MRAEVVSIGDELTSGQRLDTNSQWLSQQLGELGVEVVYHTTVADDLAANVRVFTQAASRVPLVVATGGLGPTADDLTREALAQTAGVQLELHPESLATIEALFARRQRPMPERNRVQAYFPSGSRPIPNPEGTAPGIDLRLSPPGQAPCRLFALPGVPAEMREMWRHTVAPAIAAEVGPARVMRHKRLKCFGVGESDLEQMLPDLIRRGREPQVGITVSGATITLRVTAVAANEAECAAAIAPTLHTIRECLGDLVFGEDDDELEHAVARLLIDRGETLALAEEGTGGLITHWFGELTAPLSKSFRGAVVGPKTEDGSEMSDEEYLKALAEGCRDLINADHVLATGEFPQPAADTAAPGNFNYAVIVRGAEGDKLVCKQSPFTGHSAILKVRAAKQALNLLRLELIRDNQHVRRV